VGNFLYLPTDCPQRDERLGWTGDIQVFSPPRPTCSTATASWRRGQWPSMVAWTDAVLRDTTDGLWSNRGQFGDWLDPAAPPESPGAARTHKDIVATACLIRTLDTMVTAARVLGESPSRFEAEAARIRDAFQAEYVTPNGRMASDAETAYAMAIAWNLVPDEKRRQRMGARLRELVREDGYIIGTGFVGTPLVCDALTATGYQAAAGKLLLSTRCPSWLYSVTMGATTVWERYDSMLPDGSINPGEMTSFNHYALGAVADWLHRVLAGLAPLEPGYRTVLVAPQPIADLTWASTRHTSAYGDIAVRWERTSGQLLVDVTVPPNSEAVVRLPGRDDERVRSGQHHFEVADPIPAPGPITPATTLGAIIDDTEAYAVVETAMSEAGAADALARLTWSSSATIASVPFVIPPPVAAVIATRLEELSATR
jgi:alpha-L-rhamnosidase